MKPVMCCNICKYHSCLAKPIDGKAKYVKNTYRCIARFTIDQTILVWSYVCTLAIPFVSYIARYELAIDAPLHVSYIFKIYYIKFISTWISHNICGRYSCLNRAWNIELQHTLQPKTSNRRVVRWDEDNICLNSIMFVRLLHQLPAKQH